MFYKLRKMSPLIAAWLTRGVLARDTAERYVGFSELGLFDASPFHLAYQPDDFRDHGLHQEFRQLHDSFLRHNSRNNSGDLGRLWALMLNIKDVLDRGVQGDFAELGVWRGNTAAVLAHYSRGRKTYLFDTFEGFDRRDLVGVDAEQQARFADTSLDTVRQVVADPWEACRFVKGYFPESIQDEHTHARYAVVSIDCDLQEPMSAALAFFYPRLTDGGVLFIHDYANAFWPGVRSAVDAFCGERRLFPVLMPDKSGSAVLRKTEAT